MNRRYVYDETDKNKVLNLKDMFQQRNAIYEGLHENKMMMHVAISNKAILIYLIEYVHVYVSLIWHFLRGTFRLVDLNYFQGYSAPMKHLLLYIFLQYYISAIDTLQSCTFLDILVNIF